MEISSLACYDFHLLNIDFLWTSNFTDTIHPLYPDINDNQLWLSTLHPMLLSPIYSYTKPQQITFII